MYFNKLIKNKLKMLSGLEKIKYNNLKDKQRMHGIINV
jgi:hypothetical protein